MPYHLMTDEHMRERLIRGQARTVDVTLTEIVQFDGARWMRSGEVWVRDDEIPRLPLGDGKPTAQLIVIDNTLVARPLVALPLSAEELEPDVPAVNRAVRRRRRRLIAAAACLATAGGATTAVLTNHDLAERLTESRLLAPQWPWQKPRETPRSVGAVPSPPTHPLPGGPGVGVAPSPDQHPLSGMGPPSGMAGALTGRSPGPVGLPSPAPSTPRPIPASPPTPIPTPMPTSTPTTVPTLTPTPTLILTPTPVPILETLLPTVTPFPADPPRNDRDNDRDDRDDRGRDDRGRDRDRAGIGIRIGIDLVRKGE